MAAVSENSHRKIAAMAMRMGIIRDGESMTGGFGPSAMNDKPRAAGPAEPGRRRGKQR
jgi:hypothetical protein